MSKMALAWNLTVGAIFLVAVAAFSFHLFGNINRGYEEWTSHQLEFNRNSGFCLMLEGPIYLCLFIAYALHFSTAYSRLNTGRGILAGISTFIPLALIAASLIKTDSSFLYYVFVEFAFHAGPLLVLTSLVFIYRTCIWGVIGIWYNRIRGWRTRTSGA